MRESECRGEARQGPVALQVRLARPGRRRFTDGYFAFINRRRCCLLAACEQRLRLAFFAFTGLMVIARLVTSATMPKTASRIDSS